MITGQRASCLFVMAPTSLIQAVPCGCTKLSKPTTLTCHRALHMTHSSKRADLRHGLRNQAENVQDKHSRDKPGTDMPGRSSLSATRRFQQSGPRTNTLEINPMAPGKSRSVLVQVTESPTICHGHTTSTEPPPDVPSLDENTECCNLGPTMFAEFEDHEWHDP